MKLIILIFSYAFGWNQIINVPEDTKQIHLDIYLTNNMTTTSTTIEVTKPTTDESRIHDSNYDFPNNFEAIYKKLYKDEYFRKSPITACENYTLSKTYLNRLCKVRGMCVNRKLNTIRNQLFSVPHKCLVGGCSAGNCPRYGFK